MQPLLSPKSTGKLFLLGNEAIVRGALEANVRFVAAYPGTPSSEIIDRFYQIASDAGVYVEYSVNEKVAMETASAAAVSGVRSLCAMKHVGLNVAADAFMTLAYVGVTAGMVMITADDPSLHSSQNEQDNRYYAKMAGIPMLEPSDVAEAKEMTVAGFALSQRFQIPCLVRTTTRVNHCRGSVRLDELPSGSGKGAFDKDPFNRVVVPMVGRKLRQQLLEKQKAMEKAADESPFNIATGTGRWGIICSGIACLHVKDAIKRLGLENRMRVLKLGFTNPAPRGLIRSFLAECEKVLVVEELEPFLEETARTVAQQAGIAVEIGGKGPIPQSFELDTSLVAAGIASFFDLDYQPPQVFEVPELPPRPPNLCAGCPHRATYYAVKQVFEEEAVYPTDIGCYTLGVLPPLKAADFLVCMGSSVSTAGGFSKVLDRPVVAFIGDSTFFHAGIPPLVSAVMNDHRFLLVILDNGTTAMTGHQPNPGVEIGPGGKFPPKVRIEDVVRGCGVQRVATVNPLQVKKTIKTLEEVRRAMAEPGISVVIAKSPCPLFARRMLKQQQKVVFQVDESCDLCKKCLSELGCTAFVWRTNEKGEEWIQIDEALCNGCSVCSQICHAIKPQRLSR